MKAWEIATNLYRNAKPRILEEEDQTWKVMNQVSDFYDSLLGLDWSSNVPGSGAPERIMVAAVQALENRGYIVKNSEELIEKGIKAHEEGDYVTLHKISALLRHELLNAEKDPNSPYWNYKYYDSYEEYKESVEFPEAVEVDVNSEEFTDKIKSAWLSQLIGAAMGTQVEGYTSENLYKAFGEIHHYLREPNTYNDDITFELAFLNAFYEKGYNVTSKDIALEWVGIVPAGWSAEEIALRNIKHTSGFTDMAASGKSTFADIVSKLRIIVLKFFRFNFRKFKRTKAGSVHNKPPDFSSKSSACLVVCLPLSILSLISPVSITYESKILFSMVDFPTPDCPAKNSSLSFQHFRQLFKSTFKTELTHTVSTPVPYSSRL